MLGWDIVREEEKLYDLTNSEIKEKMIAEGMCPSSYTLVEIHCAGLFPRPCESCWDIGGGKEY